MSAVIAEPQTKSRVAFFSSKKYDIDSFNKELSLHTQVEQDQIAFEYHPEELNAKTAKLIHDCDTVCAFVNDKLDAECLTTLYKNGVRLIAMRCAGFNNVDLKKLTELGMKIVRVPAYSPYAVAEHAIALLLNLNRKIHKAYNRTRENNFSLDGLLGFDFYGRTVGVIGAGKIGRCFAAICKGFGMKIVYYDIVENQEMNDMGATFVNKITDVFPLVDIISLHCPLTPETKHIINKETIAQMKPNVYIVNTGRGALIDTKAAINALKKKQIGGLALDVYEQEENIFFRDLSGQDLGDDDLSRLMSFPNVILTGHQAFFTEEALEAISKTTINNILDIKKNNKSVNEITL